MTITRTASSGKQITVSLPTWQFIAAIFTIVTASIALATPWVRYQSQEANAAKISTIEMATKTNSDSIARSEERQNAAKDLEAQRYNDLREDIKGLRASIEALLLKRGAR